MLRKAALATRSFPSRGLNYSPLNILLISRAYCEKFRISQGFVKKFKSITPSFGFHGLGELVFRRTYSRLKPDGKNETWRECVERVVNGTFSMQKKWLLENQCVWDEHNAQKTAQEMFKRIYFMKFLPPGRGLWAMGSPLTEERGIFAALNNCAFISTESMKISPSKPFTFLMDASMLGVGVGFDTKGANKEFALYTTIIGPNKNENPQVYIIPDSREGWVESVRLILDSYFHNTPPVILDYSQVRPYGKPIKGFGGFASGPEPLKVLHQSISDTLEKGIGKQISVTTIVDIMNLIGQCVVAGNVRQTAEIAFGDPDKEEYLDLKNYNINPHRRNFGWTSNNSVFARLGMNYEAIVQRIVKNGEPGLAWLENMQKYSRMNGIIDNSDSRAMGGNPCLEQTLESFELCCLVETFPHKHENLEDYLETLRYAFLYAKTVTLGKTHWPETNRIMTRNRRIGCSMSGIVQFLSLFGIQNLKEWCEKGYNAIQQYDKQYSELFGIPRSIKTTSIKPSGSVSLLAGATPGIHWPISEYYIRRIRIPNKSDLLKPLADAGYPIETSVNDPNNTAIVQFPIHAGNGVRPLSKVSMWEQLSLAAFLQEYWADNQVSCTVTFDPKTEGPHLHHALDFFQYKLKGVSFLPSMDHEYPQLPYEEITKEVYERMKEKLKPVNFDNFKEDAMPSKFCDNDDCGLDNGKGS